MPCTNGFRKKASSPDFAWANWRDSFGCNGPNPSPLCNLILNSLVPLALVNVNQLCSGSPPTPTDIAITDLVDIKGIVAKLIDFTVANMHHSLCECVPGPDDPPPPTFTGGQCDGVIYRVFYTYKHNSEPNYRGPYALSAWGPINGVRMGPPRSVGGSRPLEPIEFLCRGPAGNGQPIRAYGWHECDGVLSPIEDIYIVRVERADGQPDNCGDPTGPRPDPPPPVRLPPEMPPPPPGMVGAPGRDGVDGRDGRDGVDGRDAEPCVPCADGRDGLPGRDGLDGLPGRDGVDGLPGPVGPVGPVGPAGPAGLQGRDGSDGVDGIDGEDGEDVEFVDITVNIGQCVDYEFVAQQINVSAIVGLEDQTYHHFERLFEIAQQTCKNPDLCVGEPLVSYTKSVFPTVTLYFNDARTSKFGVGRYLQIPNPNIEAILEWVDRNHLYRSGSWMAYTQYFDSKNVQVKAFGLNADEADKWRNILHSLNSFSDEDIYHPAQPRETTEKLEYNLYLVRATFFEDNSRKKSGRQTGKLIWEAQ